MGSAFSEEEEEDEHQPAPGSVECALVTRPSGAVTVGPGLGLSSQPSPVHAVPPTKGRGQGDGMEGQQDIPTQNINSKEEKEGSKIGAKLPILKGDYLEPKLGGLAISEDDSLLCPALPGGNSLEKALVGRSLPPILDNVDLRPPAPSQPLIAESKAKVYPKGSLPPALKKQREPKFVPYEPYKGATAFMEGSRANRRPSPTKHISSISQKLGGGREEDGVENSQLAANYRVMLEAKEEELMLLRERLQAQEKQLKIQTKVNSDVKQLLVASVGEDIEARVDFLTQDKARLAQDVLHYSNRVASDWEAKEALGVESDVWRSKYLASSLIVEELDRSRQEALGRAEALEHAARKLLLERAQLVNTIGATIQVVNGLSTAFDPLNRGGTSRPGDMDALQASSSLLQSARDLSTRLVGAGAAPDLNKAPESCKDTKDLPTLHSPPLTPAEEELRKVLGRPLCPERVPQAASQLLAKDARPHLLKLGDQAGAPHRHGDGGFQTCGHCSGSVHTV